MNTIKKTISAVLAAAMIQASAAPASAAFKDAAPTAGIPIVVGALSPLRAAPGIADLPGSPTLPSMPGGVPTPTAGRWEAQIPTVDMETPQAAAMLPTQTSAADVLGAAAVPENPGARSMLEQMGGLLAAAPAGELSAAASIGRRFDAARPAPDAVVIPVVAAAAPLAAEAALPAKTAAPKAAPAAARRIAGLRRSQAGAVNTKVMIIIAAVAAAAVVVALVVGLILHSGHKQNSLWQASKAKQDVVAVQKAKLSADAEALAKVAQEARQRQTTEQEPDRSFTGLAAMEAEEGFNWVSKDPLKRKGGELPYTWRERLERESASARQSGDIKALAVELRALNAELGREDQALAGFQADLRNFERQVPTAKGELGNVLEAGQSAVNEFQSERDAERALYGQYDAAVRAIVRDSLAQTSRDFRAHMDRKSSLATIAANSDLTTLGTKASEINQDLQDMVTHRQNERQNRDEAPKHANDPVIDRNTGKPVLDQSGNPVTVDNSAVWLDKAKSEADQARDAALRAKDHIKAFNETLGKLRANKDLQAAGFASMLPASAKDSNMGLNGAYFDLLDPDDLYFRAATFTEAQASDAQKRFLQVKGVVDAVPKAVDAQVQGEDKAMNDLVDQEIARQLRG